MQHIVPDLIAGNYYAIFIFLFSFIIIHKIMYTGGADIDMRNGEGMTLLHQAILKGDEKTALYLVKQGSNFDSK